MMTTPVKEAPWYRLDNTGKLYPGVISSRVTSLFRIQALMKKPVHAGALQRALTACMKRFPYYCVQLKAGFFWYYFDTNTGTPSVHADSRYPCRKRTLTRRGAFPFQVYAYKTMIAVEFSHALTDGMGALTFFKTLLAVYLTECGVVIDDWTGILRVDETPDEGEYRDDFITHFEKGLPKLKRMDAAYHISDEPEDPGIYHITTGIIPANVLVAQAKKNGVSVSAFIIATAFMALQDIVIAQSHDRLDHRDLRPLRIVVPVNIRSFFSSKSMRNFFIPIFPEIDLRLGTYTFEEVAAHVYHYLSMVINEKTVRRQLARNVRAELAVANRMAPLFLKNIVLRRLYRTLGEDTKTTSMSNLGIVSLPQSMSEHIERFDLIPDPSAITTVSGGIITFGNTMSITFGRTSMEPILEKLFFRRLVSMGVPVKIITN